MSIPIIGVSSRIPHEIYYKYPECLRSYRRFGNEPVVLGLDGGYHGLLSRAKLLRNYLRTGVVKSPVMIWSDLWDVICVRNPESIVEQFKGFNTSIVLNAERECFPDASLTDQFPDRGTPYRYLNSGFWVGETEAILEMLERADVEDDVDYQKPDGTWVHHCEQLNIQKAFLNQVVPMKLDTNGEICLTLVGAPDDEVQICEGRPYNKNMCNFPSVVHANGPKESRNWERTLEWFAMQ